MAAKQYASTLTVISVLSGD